MDPSAIRMPQPTPNSSSSFILKYVACEFSSLSLNYSRDYPMKLNIRQLLEKSHLTIWSWQIFAGLLSETIQQNKPQVNELQ